LRKQRLQVIEVGETAGVAAVGLNHPLSACH
jgi:hypothetical protein